MDQVSRASDLDGDALHVLPLSIIPLATPGLARARLIKNSRLEGVVELFAGKESGSGQIPPQTLDQVFHFDDHNRHDINIIEKLSLLPSYDVYSLRLELRRLGIEVDHHQHLRLSEAKAQELASYMGVFTRPLVRAIYGDAHSDVYGMRDLYRLFQNPDVEVARRNLEALSRSLRISLDEIPAFLEDYGDVYLSLAYYQYCFDRTLPDLQDFHGTLDELRQAPQLKDERMLHRACTTIDSRLVMVAAEVTNILDMFRARTADMWEQLPTLNFRSMRRLIGSYQAKIGAALCAVTVKMNAWTQRFPNAKAAGLHSRADFIMTDMRHGIEEIPAISAIGADD